MAAKEQPSEFGGTMGPAGVHEKPPDALSAAEKLRLGYLVGKEDPTAEQDRAAWLGNKPSKP